MRRSAIMVDVDGVLIVHPDTAGWTVNLQRDIGVSAVDLQRVFFARHWEDVVHGRASLRERLVPALEEMASDVPYETLVDYWFINDAHINEPLLDELLAIRRSGIEIYLATVQEHERASYLWNTIRFRDKFDGIYYAAAIGSAKPAAKFYRSVEDAVGLEPDALFLIDDKEVNVVSARECGWTAAVWTGHDTLGDLIAQQHWSGR